MVSRITGSGATSNVPAYPVKDEIYFHTEQVTNPKLWRPRSFLFVYLQNCKKFGNQVLEDKCEFNFIIIIIIIIIINIKDCTL
jgi:hypothetical protein